RGQVLSNEGLHIVDAQMGGGACRIRASGEERRQQDRYDSGSGVAESFHLIESPAYSEAVSGNNRPAWREAPARTPGEQAGIGRINSRIPRRHFARLGSSGR